MISCEDCQTKLVAIFDNEGTRDDEKLIDVHLKTCLECRAFQDDLVKLRRRLVCLPVPDLPISVRQQVIQIAQGDPLRGETPRPCGETNPLPLLMRFPQIAWAAGLAALLLIGMSWVVSYNLARRIDTLKQEVEISRREIALVREKEQLEEAQDRQQKAISALYFRMQELEQRVERSAPSRSAFLPAERNGL